MKEVTNLYMAEAPMMSSREIAELTSKQHSNVMRDIRVMAEELMNSNLNPCVKSSTYVGKDGRTYDQYELDKETTLCLIAGYDAALRMRIIKRWVELESAYQNALKTGDIPSLESPAFLRGLLLEYTERTIQAENQLKEQAPKVKFYDTVATTEDTADMSQVAKIINRKGYGRNKLFALLREHRVLRKNNEPYQKYVDAGWFRLIESTWVDNDGERHIYFKTVVFQRGIEGIIDLINSDEKLELEKFND